MKPNKQERITTRTPAGALVPVQVTPYCPHCNVAWPCPPAAESGDLGVVEKSGLTDVPTVKMPR
jgi:hypothetical protein